MKIEKNELKQETQKEEWLTIAELVSLDTTDTPKKPLPISKQIEKAFFSFHGERTSGLEGEFSHFLGIANGLKAERALPDLPTLTGHSAVDLRQLQGWFLKHVEGETESAAVSNNMEVRWSDDEGYMLASELVELVLLNDEGKKMDLPTLSRLCKPDGPVRYMRKGRRCKVYIQDFVQHVCGPVAITDENIEQYLAGNETRKEEERMKKSAGK